MSAVSIAELNKTLLKSRLAGIVSEISFTSIVASTLNSPVSFRVYGLNKELKRPMFHRYAKRTGVTGMDLVAENVVRNNSLLIHLMRKGR